MKYYRHAALEPVEDPDGAWVRREEVESALRGAAELQAQATDSKRIVEKLERMSDAIAGALSSLGAGLAQTELGVERVDSRLCEMQQKLEETP